MKKLLFVLVLLVAAGCGSSRCKDNPYDAMCATSATTGVAKTRRVPSYDDYYDDGGYYSDGYNGGDYGQPYYPDGYGYYPPYGGYNY